MLKKSTKVLKITDFYILNSQDYFPVAERSRSPSVISAESLEHPFVISQKSRREFFLCVSNTMLRFLWNDRREVEFII